MRGKRTVLFGLAALLLLLTACQAMEKTYQTQFMAMDTIMTLTVYGKNGQSAAELGEKRVRELEARFSVTSEDSDVCRINHSGGQATGVSTDTQALLTDALELCEATGGVLDVTMYPVIKAWGFTTGEYRIPEADELAGLLDRVDYTQVALDDRTVTLPAGMELDLGAVAKGYTGDQLMALFAETGVTSAIVELGGNVQALGTKPDGSPWRVAVQSPDGGGYAGVLEVVDKAVITSGGYQRYFEQDGETYWHIMDPDTGAPARSGVVSVTIVADRGTTADGLSTSLFIMGRDRAVAYWREHPDFEFILIDEDGTVTVTEGLEDAFSLYGDWTGSLLETVRR